MNCVAGVGGGSSFTKKGLPSNARTPAMATLGCEPTLPEKITLRGTLFCVDIRDEERAPRGMFVLCSREMCVYACVFFSAEAGLVAVDAQDGPLLINEWSIQHVACFPMLRSSSFVAALSLGGLSSIVILPHST